MPLIKCEINLILYWSTICLIAAGTATNQILLSAVIDIKLFMFHM